MDPAPAIEQVGVETARLRVVEALDDRERVRHAFERLFDLAEPQQGLDHGRVRLQAVLVESGAGQRRAQVADTGAQQRLVRRRCLARAHDPRRAAVEPRHGGGIASGDRCRPERLVVLETHRREEGEAGQADREGPDGDGPVAPFADDPPRGDREPEERQVEVAVRRVDVGGREDVVERQQGREERRDAERGGRRTASRGEERARGDQQQRGGPGLREARDDAPPGSRSTGRPAATRGAPTRPTR